MQPFVYNSHPGRVLFGTGTLSRLPEEIDRLGCKRVLILSTPGKQSQAQALAESLPQRSAGVFAGATVHTPVAVTEKALSVVTQLQADGVLAVGGGSTIGLAKAIALRTDLPQIVIPTTYAGSEMTPILGQTEQGTKTTLTHARVLPEVALYDVELTLTLPVSISGTSGLNAIAHAVEALYARERNPLTSLVAIEAIGALTRALPRIAAEPLDRAARTEALYGAWLCGICLATVGMALHHKLCHTLGGTFDLPHAETHAIVLPHALAYNAPAAPDAIAQLRVVLGEDPVQALFDLAGAVGATRGLRDLGMPKAGIDDAARRALANAYWNPRPLEFEAIRALIARAWEGQPPGDLPQ